MASGTPVKTYLRDEELSRLDRFRREQKNPPTLRHSNPRAD